MNIIGIDNNNRYYSPKPIEGRSNIVADSTTAQKYKLSIVDKLILSDTANDIDYAFTVEEILDYSVGLTVFMDMAVCVSFLVRRNITTYPHNH